MSPSGTTARGDETRQRALAAARALLVEHGPLGLSMRAVAFRAGMSLGNLQFHFRDVSGLLRALLEGELAQGAARVAVAARGTRDPVRAAVAGMLAGQRVPGAGAIFLSLWACASTSAPLRQVLCEFYDRWADQLSDALQAVVPHVPSREVRQRSHLFIATLEGASLYRCGIIGRWTRTDEVALRRALYAVLAGGTLSDSAGARIDGARPLPRHLCGRS